MRVVTAFKWVPPFAQGHVRDLRVRWALEEAGLDYEVRLYDGASPATPAGRGGQPFGQVPVLDDDGLTLFETGAIVLHVAERCAGLLSRDPAIRARTISWMFASLNSIEPHLMNLAEVDFFIEDADMKARRRPMVVAGLHRRLDQLAAALGDRPYLVDDFSAADLLMSTVLGMLDHTDVLDGYPALAAYKARCEARPAFARALEGQLSDFRANAPG